MAEWVERMRDRDVPEVARALGLDYAPPKGSSGGSFPCPACNAAKRHTKSGDKRGAAGVRRAGDGWRCFQCDVSGDVLDLVSWVEAGGPLASCGDEDKARVRTWCLDFLGLTDTPFVPRKRAPAPMRFDPLPSYPPVDEVGAVWSAAQPVTSDAGVVRWMEHERPEHGHARMDAGAVTDLDLARVLPLEAQLPTWAGFMPEGGEWRSFASVGNRLAVPLYDVEGVLRSLVFRRVFEGGDRKHKSSAVNGYQRVGLAFMCPLARTMFAARALPEWWADEAPTIYVAEGETDYLAGAVHFDGRAATLGIVAGSWTKRYARSLPDGVGVCIRTDPDKGGVPLANAVASTLNPLARRVTVRPEYDLIQDGRSLEVRLRKATA